MFSKRVILLFLVCAGMCFGQWLQADSGYPFQTTGYVWSLAVSGNKVFAGAQGGLFVSTNNGALWTRVDSGIQSTVHSFAINGIRIFAGTQGGGVFLSTDNGTSWTAVDSGLPRGTTVQSLATNVFGHVFAGTNRGLFISNNYGTSWTADSTLGLPTTTVSSVAACGSGDVFAGIANLFLVSTNNGTSWTDLYSLSVPWSFAVSGSGDVFAGTGRGVFLSSSTNGDRTTWTAVNSGLTDTTWVLSLAMSGGNLFAGTFSGDVFLSTNNGTSWTAVDSGLPLTGAISCLAVNGSYVFAGSYGNSLWRRPISEMLPTNSHEFQNKQPSVSNLRIKINKTNVAVSLPPSDGPVTVGLFSIAGKRIYSATHQASNGNLNIPISGLSTGTYLMSIRGSNTALSSRFLVTK
jgi:hypothetical protein